MSVGAIDHPGMNFALFGYGRFGQAFAGLLLQAGHRVRVHDPHASIPATLAATSVGAAMEGAQWVVMAMPVAHLREALHVVRPYLHAEHIVLDVGSVKMHPCNAMEELLGAQIAHVGTHPLFGPLSLARDERPRRVVICRAEKHPQAARRVCDLFVQLGCEVVEQDPETHDRAMARTHAMAFFIAKGLIDMGVDDGMPVAPPSFQGMKSMLAAVRGDAGHLFSAIQRENPFAAEARAQLLAELTRVHRQLLDQAEADSLDIPGELA